MIQGLTGSEIKGQVGRKTKRLTAWEKDIRSDKERERKKKERHEGRRKTGKKLTWRLGRSSGRRFESGNESQPEDKMIKAHEWETSSGNIWC